MTAPGTPRNPLCRAVMTPSDPKGSGFLLPTEAAAYGGCRGPWRNYKVRYDQGKGTTSLQGGTL